MDTSQRKCWIEDTSQSKCWIVDTSQSKSWIEDTSQKYVLNSGCKSKVSVEECIQVNSKYQIVDTSQ